MPVTVPDGVWVDNATNAVELRKALGALLAPSGPAAPRAGRLYGPGTPLKVSAKAPAAMAVTVKAGKAVLYRSAAYGPIIGVGPDGDVDVPVPAAPASGSQWHRVYLFQGDTSAPASDPTGGAYLDVVSSAAAASPQAPDVPAGGLLLGDIVVPAGSNTVTAAMVTDRPVYSAVAGSPVPVMSQAERDALASTIGYPGLTVRRLDVPSAPLEEYDGAGTWRRLMYEDDTGWLNITIAQGFAMDSTNTPQVRKRNGILYFTGAYANTGMTAGGAFAVGTLPGAARPATFVGAALASTNGDAVASGVVNAGGGLTIRPSSTLGGYYRLEGLSGFLAA